MSNPFDALGGLGGLGSMLGGFQQRMQEIQDQVKEQVFTASAGGDLVTVQVKGSLELLSVNIRDGAEEDKDMLEDLIVIATNRALQEAQSQMQTQMAQLTAGLPIPPGMLGF